jgi:chemotaxis protein MotB
MSEQIRVIKKKRGHGGGHHGGAWKVAYADFVTAMMAFFLVMWIVGLNSAVKEAIAAYFQDPVAFMSAVERGEKPFQVEGSGIMTVPEMKTEVTKDSMKLAEDRHEQKRKFEEVKSSLERLIAEYPEFKDLAKSIKVEVISEGLRIDLIESSPDLFFDSGSATTKPGTKALLGKMARELGRLPNKVVIEGHTDSRPYRGPHGWTNWELSTARANSARSVMEDAGLRAGQMIEVRGLADTMPLDPKNRDSFKNRRVSILLPFEMIPKYAEPSESKPRASEKKPADAQVMKRINAVDKGVVARPTSGH